jgi:hypothetical protein
MLVENAPQLGQNVKNIEFLLLDGCTKIGLDKKVEYYMLRDGYVCRAEIISNSMSPTTA